MATYPLNQVIRGTMEFSLSGGIPAYIVLHFGKMTAGAANQASVDAVAAALNDLATDTFSTFQFTNGLSQETNIVAGHARTVDPTNPLAADVTINENGNIPGEPVPYETAYVVTHYTGLASRRGRGRSFVPGVALNQVVDARLQASFVDAHTDIWAGWAVQLAAAGVVEFVVWSPTNNTAQSWTTSLVRPVLHHQSSRNP